MTNTLTALDQLGHDGARIFSDLESIEAAYRGRLDGMTKPGIYTYCDEPNTKFPITYVVWPGHLTNRGPTSEFFTVFCFLSKRKEDIILEIQQRRQNLEELLDAIGAL